MKNEIWKDIKGYEGWYQVSQYGRVRSLPRTVHFKNGKWKREYPGRILKQKYHNGYAEVNLLRNKRLSTRPVHRLVAEAFIPNPDSHICVNHISGIKADNRAENLEWCSFKENNRHAKEMGLRQDNISGLLKNNAETAFAVECWKGSHLLHVAESSREMAQWLKEYCGIAGNVETLARNIRRCSSGHNGIPQYGGYIFRRRENKATAVPEKGEIIIKDKTGAIAAIAGTSAEAADWLIQNGYARDVQSSTVRRAIRSAIREKRQYHGFHFIRLGSDR